MMENLQEHLRALDDRYEPILEALVSADRMRRQALQRYEHDYAVAYLNAGGPPSAEQVKKQFAILATVKEKAVLEEFESECRFRRDELRVLGERVGIARSLWSGAKAATT